MTQIGAVVKVCSLARPDLNSIERMTTSIQYTKSIRCMCTVIHVELDLVIFYEIFDLVKHRVDGGLLHNES